MPKKVTKEQADRIVYLRDVERLSWERISEDVDLDVKTCKRHHDLRKEEEKGPRGEGEVCAEAFRLFDRGGKPSDAVRELEITMERAKDLYTEYLDMGKKENDGEEAELSISKEFKVFKKRGNLSHTCQELLGKLDYRFEPPLTRERDLIKERINFLREKVGGVEDPEVLEKLGELLESERKEIKDLMDRDQKLYAERLEKERAAKERWIIRRWMDQGMCEKEAKERVEEVIRKRMELLNVKNGLEGLYNLEKRRERDERTRTECLKFMSPEDYERLSMLFLRSLPSAEYPIDFWRQEREIIARYGKRGWRELCIFYDMHRDALAEKKPNLQKEFAEHLWRRGLQPCPHCDFILNIIGTPRHVRCPRCDRPLTRIDS